MDRKPIREMLREMHAAVNAAKYFLPHDDPGNLRVCRVSYVDVSFSWLIIVHILPEPSKAKQFSDLNQNSIKLEYRTEGGHE